MITIIAFWVWFKPNSFRQRAHVSVVWSRLDCGDALLHAASPAPDTHRRSGAAPQPEEDGGHMFILPTDSL